MKKITIVYFLATRNDLWSSRTIGSHMSFTIYYIDVDLKKKKVAACRLMLLHFLSAFLLSCNLKYFSQVAFGKGETLGLSSFV